MVNIWDWRACYYRFARSWGPLRRIKSREDGVAADFLSRINPMPTAYVDLGCGLGSSIPNLDFIRKIGLDYSRGMLKRSEADTSDYLVCGDVRFLPFKTGFSSLAVAIGVAEYLPSPQVWFSEAARILRPGGYFLVTTTPPGWWRIARRLTGGRIYSHIASVNISAAASVGFQLTDTRRISTQEVYLFRKN